MTKKSMKSKSIRKQPKYNKDKISYDRHSFILGGMKVLTDYLTKQTKDFLIKLYRKKQLNVLVKNNNFPSDSYNEKFVVLTQNQAVEIIKHRALMKQRNKLQKQHEKNDQFMRKINLNQMTQFSKYQQQKSKILTSQNQIKSQYQKYKNLMQETFKSLYNNAQHINKQIHQRIEQDHAKLRKLIQTKILSIEMQLFVSTILMIIQVYQQESDRQRNLDQDQYQQITQNQNCFIVFQQSYPPKSFTKMELIQLIGKQQYQAKKLHTLKIYHTSITHQHFFNPHFIGCHDCMKIITNVGFPQHDIKCLKILNGQKQKNVQSHFMITPKNFLDNFINHQFFNSYEKKTKDFQHPFIQYHIKTLKDEKLVCGRNWCGPCLVKYKRGMSMTHCDFCDFICECPRCEKYEKFIKLLGYYLKFGGKINQIQEEFVFNQVFGQQISKQSFYHQEQNQSVQVIKNNIFKRHLKMMYEFQLRNSQKIMESKKWLQLKKSFLLSGVFPDQNKAGDSLIFNRKDQIRRKNKDQFDKFYQTERKNYQKYAHEKKQKNIDLTISKLDQSIKSRIMQTQLEQFFILKRKLQKSKILKTSNPLTNIRSNTNNMDIIIFSQSSLRKNQRKFHQLLQIKEMNPIQKARQERVYRKVKRLEYQQKRIFQNQRQYQEGNQKGFQQSSLKNAFYGKNAPLNRKASLDQNDQNYGSMWQ